MNDFTFALEGALGVRDVSSLHRRLCEWDSGNQPLHVDTSLLTDADTSVIQLLMAVDRCTADDARPGYAELPPVLRNSLELAGATHLLDSWTAAASQAESDTNKSEA